MRCIDTNALVFAEVPSAPNHGSLLHDAHIAALCVEHGVSEFLTADRDFRRFDGLNVVDPFRQ